MSFTRIRYSFYRENHYYKELFMGFTIDMDRKSVYLNYIGNHNQEISKETKINDKQYSDLVLLIEKLGQPADEGSIHFFINEILTERLEWYDNQGTAFELVSCSDYPNMSETGHQLIYYVINEFAPDYRYSRKL